MNTLEVTLNQLIKELVSLGENGEELSMWRSLFVSMTYDEQGRLLENLSKELETLKKA